MGQPANPGSLGKMAIKTECMCALSHVISEIFNVEKCCDLEILVGGHSRSSKVVPFDRLCMVSY